MAFTKITNAQLNSRGATTLPNQPTISATALKQEFDAPAKNIVAPAFNNLVDELEATTAAADIGAVAPSGRVGNSVQALLNNLSDDLNSTESVAHTHANKTLLDDYTQTETDLADAVSKKHDHSNKTVLDNLSDNGGKLEYDGSPIGAVKDAFKSVQVGSDVLVASGEDTLQLVAGDNISLTPDLSTNSVTIKSTGGGGGGGSANWGSIGGTLSNQTDLKNALDAKQATLTASDGIDIDGSNNVKVKYGDTLKIDSVTTKLEVAAKNLYVPTGTSSDRPVSGQAIADAIDQTYSASSTKAQSGVAVASGISAAVSGKADASDLPVQISRTNVTIAADSDVRIPASGTNSNIKTTSTVFPVGDKKDGTNTPWIFKAVKAYAGYVEITSGEALSGADVGIIVFNN